MSSYSDTQTIMSYMVLLVTPLQNIVKGYLITNLQGTDILIQNEHEIKFQIWHDTIKTALRFMSKY